MGRTPRLQSDITVYLLEYRRRRRELLKRKPESLIHQYSESVLTTWETSYDAVHEQSPEASTLMLMLSFLSFDDIFLQLFGTDRQLKSTGSTHNTAETASSPFMDSYKLEECFEMLQRYSFVQWKEDRRSYAMHKLVHAWGYDRLAKDEQVELGNATFELVVEAIDGCRNTPEDKLRLVPHVMANFTTVFGASGALYQTAKGTLDELARVGIFMTDIGLLQEGCLIETYVLNDRRGILGEEHLDTVSAMHNLAKTLGDLGQFDEAAKIQKEVLEKWRRILGEEHRNTISAMNNLASTLTDLGQLDNAILMLEVAVQKMRRIHGEEHPRTKIVVGNWTRLVAIRAAYTAVVANKEEQR